jgi:hypothetical protein
MKEGLEIITSPGSSKGRSFPLSSITRIRHEGAGHPTDPGVTFSSIENEVAYDQLLIPRSNESEFSHSPELNHIDSRFNR